MPWPTGRPRLHGVSILEANVPREAAHAAAAATRVPGGRFVLLATRLPGGRFVLLAIRVPGGRFVLLAIRVRTGGFVLLATRARGGRFVFPATRARRVCLALPATRAPGGRLVLPATRARRVCLARPATRVPGRHFAPALVPVARRGASCQIRCRRLRQAGGIFVTSPAGASHTHACASHDFPCGHSSRPASVSHPLSAGPPAGRPPHVHLGTSATSARLVAWPRAGRSAGVEWPVHGAGDDRICARATRADLAGDHPGCRISVRVPKSAAPDHRWSGRAHALALA